jgi:septal ring factor EnvC (AmiA/AmiB activator)
LQRTFPVLILLCLFLAPGLALSPLPALAQAGELSSSRSDLDELKKRIRSLQEEVARTESDRAGALKAVAAAEREVSQAKRRLLELQRQQKALDAELAALQGEHQTAEAALAARGDALAQWLYRHYVHRGMDGLASLLSTQDPSQLARDAYYSERLGRVRLALIAEVRVQLTELELRKREMDDKRSQLNVLARSQEAQRSKLDAGLLERKAALGELSAQLKAQKLEVSTLRQDEQRLARLIDTLVRRAREAAAREAARKAAAERAAREAAAATAAQAARPAPPVRQEAVVGRATASAGARPAASGVNFSQLRGRLLFPVRGELIGRFGAPRAEGGTSWKGVFIRIGTGADVKAVAAGEVVFSDWLRGYGNLIIIDHGEDYLTVYGNNDSLLKEVGDAVTSGEAIASVGSSGGGGDSGLYFELRHQGRPLDPLKWVRLN